MHTGSSRVIYKCTGAANDFTTIQLKGDILLMTKFFPFNERLMVNWRTGGMISLDFSELVVRRISLPQTYGFLIQPKNGFRGVKHAILTEHSLIVVGDILGRGYSALSLNLRSLENCWTIINSASALANSGIKVMPSSDMISIVPLPVPTARTTQIGPDFFLDGEPAFVVWDCTAFTPSWYSHAPTTVLLACTFGNKMLSYQLEVVNQPSNENVKVIASPEINLVSNAVSHLSERPQSPHALSNRGHMFLVDSHLHCYSIFADKVKQPVASTKLDDEFDPATRLWYRPAAVVDPWSGAIAVHINGEIKVLYFD